MEANIFLSINLVACDKTTTQLWSIMLEHRGKQYFRPFFERETRIIALKEKLIHAGLSLECVRDLDKTIQDYYIWVTKFK